MNELIENFQSVYKRLDSSNIGLVKTIYDEEIKFIDPFHEMNGLETLVDYFERLYRNLENCEFDFLSVYANDSSAMLTWNMTFTHKSLGSRPIQVPGSTEIRYKDKINFHRDYFDAGKMLYENIPVISSAIKFIKKQV